MALRVYVEPGYLLQGGSQMKDGKTMLKWAVSSLGILLLSAVPALADILVHNSQEDYFGSGGTRIVDILNGSTTTTVGTVTGDPLWQVNEKVFYDPILNKTTISYTVFNDNYAATDRTITSFHVPYQVAPNVVSPGPDATWSNSLATPGYVIWTTTGPGIPLHSSIDTFQLTYRGNLGIGFCNGVKNDLGPTHLIQTGENWVVSCATAIPSPGALILGLMGLGLVGRMKRHLA